MEDIFQWCREGNAMQVRVWLDDTEHDMNQGYSIYSPYLACEIPFSPPYTHFILFFAPIHPSFTRIRSVIFSLTRTHYEMFDTSTFSMFFKYFFEYKVINLSITFVQFYLYLRTKQQKIRSK